MPYNWWIYLIEVKFSPCQWLYVLLFEYPTSLSCRAMWHNNVMWSRIKDHIVRPTILSSLYDFYRKLSSEEYEDLELDEQYDTKVWNFLSPQLCLSSSTVRFAFLSILLLWKSSSFILIWVNCLDLWILNILPLL